MSEPGSQLAAMRKRVDKRCEHCGALMRGVLKKRLYCDERCLNAAKYQRRKKSAPASADKG